MIASKMLRGSMFVLCACALARADVSISQYDVNGDQVGDTVHKEAGNNTFDITVIDSTVRSILVFASPSTLDIGRITVTDDGLATDVRLYIATETVTPALDAVFYIQNSQRACRHWHGLENLRSAGNLLLKAHIAGDLRNTIIGPGVSATHGLHLNTLEVTERIGAMVSSKDGFYRITCGRAVPLGGSVPQGFLSEKGIELVRATSSSPTAPGDIQMDVLANIKDDSAGYLIEAIEAPNGRIGTSGSAVSPSVPLIGTTQAQNANVSIARITAKNGINADIIALHGIALLQTTSVAAGGNVEGTIKTSRLNERQPNEGGLFDIAGDLSAIVTLTNELPADASIRVGSNFGVPQAGGGAAAGSLWVGSVLGVQLKGQIIFGNSATGNSQNWKANVQIGDAFLLGPVDEAAGKYYSYTSADLGGGAVGVVPFHRHSNDCEPPDYVLVPHIYQSQLNHHMNGTVMVPQVPILDRYYGPIQTDTLIGTGIPVRILHQLSGTEFLDVTGRFTVEMNPSGPASARTIKVKGKADTFYYPGLYFIDPITTGTSKLYCDVPGKPAVHRADANSDGVADDAYAFIVDWDCNGNLKEDWEDIRDDGGDGNGDGRLDSCDRPGWCGADYDDNGFVNGNDFDLFVEVFEAGLDMADTNGDGFVNGIDFDQFGIAFEAGC